MVKGIQFVEGQSSIALIFIPPAPGEVSLEGQSWSRSNCDT